MPDRASAKRDSGYMSVENDLLASTLVWVVAREPKGGK